MPDFAIIAHDAAGKALLRAETLPRHLDHLRTIEDRVVAAGPLLDESGTPIGSLVIARFDDLAAAQRFAAADPYAQAGVFGDVGVSAWRQVFPDVG